MSILFLVDLSIFLGVCLILWLLFGKRLWKWLTFNPVKDLRQKIATAESEEAEIDATLAQLRAEPPATDPDLRQAELELLGLEEERKHRTQTQLAGLRRQLQAVQRQSMPH